MKYARTATFPAVLLKLLMAFMRFAAVSDMWLEQLQFSVLDAMTFESILLAFMIFGFVSSWTLFFWRLASFAFDRFPRVSKSSVQDRFSGSRLGLTDESISCFKYSCVFAQMHRSSYKQLQYSRVDLRNSCVFAAMHRSPYQPQSDEVTFLYSGVQAAMHSDPYKHQAGDYKLLSDTILQQALGDDLFDSFFYDEALHNGDAMPWCDPEVHLSELTQADLDATMHASAASVTTTAAPAAIPEAQTGGKTTAAAPGISLTAIPAPLVRRLSEPLDEELPPPQLLENILPANGPVTKDDIAPTVDLVSDCSHPSNPHQTSTAVFASASLGAETPYMPRNMADTAESLFSATSQMIDAYDTLSTADFIASPLYAAVNRLALAQNIAIMAEFDRICSNIHHVAAPTLQAKPTLQKRLSAKFSTAKALTSKLSLRRLSPSLSKKAPMKASLASLDGNDSDADDTATSDIPRETFGAKAQRSLRRSTSSFKIAAQKLTSVVRPTCLGGN